MSANEMFLVDDDLFFRVASDVLIKRGIPELDIVQFENGLEAYQALVERVENLESLPKLLFLDLNMPIMSGWEFLEELKGVSSTICEQIQIYIVSSSIAPEDVNLFETYDFVNGYISKPLTLQDLEKVNETLSLIGDV